MMDGIYSDQTQIVVDGKINEGTLPSDVLYKPGNEPVNIRRRLDRLFEKLDQTYPDKVVVGIHKDHKKWGETGTELYRKLGYPDGKSFLNAYGYTMTALAGGRPSSTDPSSIVGRRKHVVLCCRFSCHISAECDI